MKPTRPTYILAAEQISIQGPLVQSWLYSPIIPHGQYNTARDPSFKEWLTPGEARRLGKLLKRAVATSAQCIQHSAINTVDAIITATGLGCVTNTELFLTDLCSNGESLLKPTQFMQSTHNTIGSLIAILNKCHGYNVTYAHKDISAEIAILDAITMISDGDVHNVLVGAHDEMTPNYYKMLCRVGYYGIDGMVTSGETAVSLMISDISHNALCRVDEVMVKYNVSDDFINAYLDTIDPGTCLVAGFNGRPENDSRYRSVLKNRNGNTPILQFKNIFGESFTSSSLGIYAAAHILNAKHVPAIMTMQRHCRHNTINSIVCLNINDSEFAAVKLSAI